LDLINFSVFIFTFFAMEFVAWFTHRFIMHGLLWYFHRDHHTRDNKGFFEKNDFFFLIFAIPGSILIIYGIEIGLEFIAFWIGMGISFYGMAYFFVHDLFIHQRVKVLKKTKNRYLLGIRRGHKAHHKKLSKEDGVCFGMLLVPLKYFRQFK
tara:strand:+ start:115 stop:570 length:456 start_codon:yes stop_codon:yes gene_type:complete